VMIIYPGYLMQMANVAMIPTFVATCL
jgi:hypothetical protein